MEREMANLVVDVRLHDYFLSTYTDISSIEQHHEKTKFLPCRKRR